MRLRMLELSLGKGCQVIKQLYYATVVTKYMVYRALVNIVPHHLAANFFEQHFYLLNLAANRRRRVTAIVWRLLFVRPVLSGKGRLRESMH